MTAVFAASTAGTVHQSSRAYAIFGLWHTVAYMNDFNAETDEDNGYAKPAGPVWGIVGGLIGLVVGLSLIWFVISHH
jgi:hypothetical protein